MKSDNYIPVECSLVDWIEIYATKKERVKISYLVNGELGHIEAIIKTWQTSNGAEYLILNEDHVPIRLDHIVKLGEFEVSQTGTNTCQIK